MSIQTERFRLKNIIHLVINETKQENIIWWIKTGKWFTFILTQLYMFNVHRQCTTTSNRHIYIVWILGFPLRTKDCWFYVNCLIYFLKKLYRSYITLICIFSALYSLSKRGLLGRNCSPKSLGRSRKRAAIIVCLSMVTEHRVTWYRRRSNWIDGVMSIIYVLDQRFCFKDSHAEFEKNGYFK